MFSLPGGCAIYSSFFKGSTGSLVESANHLLNDVLIGYSFLNPQSCDHPQMLNVGFRKIK